MPTSERGKWKCLWIAELESADEASRRRHDNSVKFPTLYYFILKKAIIVFPHLLGPLEEKSGANVGSVWHRPDLVAAVGRWHLGLWLLYGGRGPGQRQRPR